VGKPEKIKITAAPPGISRRRPKLQTEAERASLAVVFGAKSREEEKGRKTGRSGCEMLRLKRNI
jgi:hypothetical protein